MGQSAGAASLVRSLLPLLPLLPRFALPIGRTQTVLLHGIRNNVQQDRAFAIFGVKCGFLPAN
jgi:hypothetical protein